MHSSSEKARAATGDHVWVLLNHVKADMREQFEWFVHELIWPLAQKAEPHMARQSRVLHPTEQNDDGTYTYVFLLDPVVEGGDYIFENLLRRTHSEEKVAEYMQIWENTLASPQIGYFVTQSEH
jgi:hypothetical protein